MQKEELIEKALNIQMNKEFDISKDVKDYAFTFIYPPNNILYELEENPYSSEMIKFANLYIHIPYCTGRCTYCYFGCYCLSEAPIAKKIYIQNICDEMRMIYEKIGAIELLSIHFGGGTPTILNEQEIEQIFDSIRKYFILKPDIEITFESSPETLTQNKIRQLRSNGVNRLNIGIQTLNDDLLKSINRRHDAKTAIKSIEMAIDMGISNINVDVMYGLYGQTMNDWLETLDIICNMNLQSISTYRLRIHPNGKISDQMKYFDEVQAIKMYINMLEKMEKYSFYQCSSHKFAIQKEFAQKQIINKRGIKNNTLIAIGMAAYGYVGNTVFWNERKIEGYINKISNNQFPYSIGYKLDKEEEIAKSCVLGIHNVDGINLIQYTNKFGEEIFERYGKLISILMNKELIELDDKKLKLSKLGMVFADEIATQFYSEKIRKLLKEKNKKYGIFFEEILN